MNDTIHKIKTAEQLAKNPFGKMKSMANSSIKKGMKKQGFNFKKPTINRVMNHFFGKKKNNKKK